MRGSLEAKVARSLADVWQKMFEQQDITVICIIHFHPWLRENHTDAGSAPEPGNTESPTETDTQEHVYQNRGTSVNELKQLASD